MDASYFDALARAVTQAVTRRSAVTALALGLAAPWLTGDAEAKKKRKKKKKKKCKVACGGRVCGASNCPGKSCGSCPGGQRCTAEGQCACVPDCSGRQCGADGCGGICSPGCGLGLNCNAQGQCVGCTSVAQCSIQFCKQAACTNETCVYSNLPDDTPCLLTNRCCGGECIDPQTDSAHCGECGNACAPRGDTCAAGGCRCGSGNLCPLDATCVAGQCQCPANQVLCLNECLAGACCALGKGCTANEDCCQNGDNPDQRSCVANICCKNQGSTCSNANECCSGFCSPVGNTCG